MFETAAESVTNYRRDLVTNTDVGDLLTTVAVRVYTQLSEIDERTKCQIVNDMRSNNIQRKKHDRL